MKEWGGGWTTSGASFMKEGRGGGGGPLQGVISEKGKWGGGELVLCVSKIGNKL